MELWSASKLKVPELDVFSDSKLMVNQITRKFEARGGKMAKYLAVANNLLTEFEVVKMKQVGGLEFTCRHTGRLAINF